MTRRAAAVRRIMAALIRQLHAEQTVERLRAQVERLGARIQHLRREAVAAYEACGPSGW